MNHTKNLSMHRGLLRTVAILMMLFMLVPLTSGLANAAEPTLSEGYMTVSAAAGTRTVTVKNATGTISATSDAPGWLSCTVSGNKVTVRFQQNQYAAKRSGTITVKVGTRKLFIFVNQVCKLVVRNMENGASATSGTFGGYASGKNVYLTVTGSGTITAKANQSWINVSVASNQVRITVKDNFSGAKRSGKVTISDGWSTATYNVTQNKYAPGLHSFSFMFSMKSVSQEFKNAYKPFIDGRFDKASDSERLSYMDGLISQTLAYLNLSSCPEEYVYCFAPELAGAFGPEVIGLYGGYSEEGKIVIINRTNANTGALVAKAILHETRHFWQYRYGKYNGTYSEYVIKYGCDNYTKASDTTQILEVDAATFADKLVAMLK